MRAAPGPAERAGAVARKVAAPEPVRPAVRRVARSTEPPIIPVEPAADVPEAADVVPEVPSAAEPVEETPARRGLFRRVVDAFRGGGDDEPPSPDAEPVEESTSEHGETDAPGATLSRSVAAPDARPSAARRQPRPDPRPPSPQRPRP